uniref:Uncharacterized protein n=1 Tax=Rhizophora mucronata TaxID=61149 RepID=A0A2P2NLR3_RHIMU
MQMANLGTILFFSRSFYQIFCWYYCLSSLK